MQLCRVHTCTYKAGQKRLTQLFIATVRNNQVYPVYVSQRGLELGTHMFTLAGNSLQQFQRILLEHYVFLSLLLQNWVTHQNCKAYNVTLISRFF